jgi:hypothetical protein
VHVAALTSSSNDHHDEGEHVVIHCSCPP